MGFQEWCLAVIVASDAVMFVAVVWFLVIVIRM